MLAPEEVFAGKGGIKEETELTQAERKRRRANKKRKFKGKAYSTILYNNCYGYVSALQSFITLGS